MIDRRTLVALAACVMLTASTALAGGNGGSKKDSTIEVVNETDNIAYVFVDVPDARIEAAANSADPIAAFNDLGGKQLAGGGGSVEFKVRSGNHTVTAIDIEDEVAIGKQTVLVNKGETRTVTFE